MKEIDNTELQSLSGGALPWLVTVAGGALIVSIVNGWSDFKEGFIQGYKNQTRHMPLE